MLDRVAVDGSAADDSASLAAGVSAAGPLAWPSERAAQQAHRLAASTTAERDKVADLNRVKQPTRHRRESADVGISRAAAQVRGTLDSISSDGSSLPPARLAAVEEPGGGTNERPSSYTRGGGDEAPPRPDDENPPRAIGRSDTIKITSRPLLPFIIRNPPRRAGAVPLRAMIAPATDPQASDREQLCSAKRRVTRRVDSFKASSIRARPGLDA